MLDVVEGPFQEFGDVVVVQGLDDRAALALAGDQAEVAQQAQLVGAGGLFHAGGVGEFGGRAGALLKAGRGAGRRAHRHRHGAGGCSDLALETADAVIVRDELATVPAVIALSRRARKLVVQNLVIARVFIAGLVVWDLAGNLPLPLGVAGHEGSTVIVGLNGLRLLRESAWRQAAE